MRRREFLESTMQVSIAGLGLGSGLVPWSLAEATGIGENEAAFGASTVEQALTALYGTADYLPSQDVTLTAPDKAEVGAEVPVGLSSSLPDVRSVSLLVTTAANPLAIEFRPGEGTDPSFSTRVKICRTGYVVGVVDAGGKLYGARHLVYVRAEVGCVGKEEPDTSGYEPKGSIRWRLRKRRGRVRMKARIHHPMNTAHHLKELRLVRREEQIFVAYFGAAVSEDPRLEISFSPEKAGYLELSWKDTRGLSSSDSAHLK